MRALLATVVALSQLAPSAAAQDQKRSVQPSDLYHLTSVDDPALSPTGDRIAYEVTTVREEEDDRFTSVWMQRLDGGAPVGSAYRFTTPAHDASSPRWSPTGELLSFTSRRGEDPNRIWFARMGDGGGEAFHIDGVEGSPIWSPDGQWIAFLAVPDSLEERVDDERAGAVAPDAVSEAAVPERFDGHVITHLNHRQDGSPDPLPHPSAMRRDQLFVVPSGGGEPVQLTHFEHSVEGVAWSPDGRALFATVNESEGEDVRFNSRVRIVRVDRDGSIVTELTEGEGSRSSLAPSPDGSRLAFRLTSDYGAPTEIALIELDEGTGIEVREPRILTGDWPLSPGQISWTPDGDVLRFTARRGGTSHLFELEVESREIRQITNGRRRLGSVSFGGDTGWMAYVSASATRPDQIALARTDGSEERRITSFNDSLLAELRIQEPERLTWRVADGTEIEGWLIPPAQRRDDGSYPMVLSIHGGPHAAYGYSFSVMFQMLSGAGYYVFYLNPRGSSGYGHDFQWSIDRGWGDTDEEDFITGVEHVLSRVPQIDRRRLGVTGWSYGGFMTNWLTARSDLFTAAVTGASVVDWESDAGTTDIWYTIHNEFGPLWEAREIYRRLSPLSYVENVTAPTLILHGQYDVRVPYKNAEQWFRVLKMRGIPVELVRYPDTGHVLRRPWHAVDRMERTRGWFDHWLREEAPRR